MASVYRFLLSPGRIDAHTARCARAQGRHSALAIHVAPRDYSVQIASVCTDGTAESEMVILQHSILA